jgi:hypothetical protein
MNTIPCLQPKNQKPQQPTMSVANTNPTPHDYYMCFVTTVEYIHADGECYRVWEAAEKEGVIAAPRTPIDPDFEEVLSDEDWIAQDMKKRRKAYGIRYMFNQAHWKCTPLGKERIKELCKKCDIPMNTVIRVFKHLETWVPAHTDTQKD